MEFQESIMYTAHSKYIAAHPGWIMGGSALDDFAAPGSFAYLRREVIVWGDSVKLRYGKRPEDAPFLWGYMLEYVKLTARYATSKISSGSVVQSKAHKIFHYLNGYKQKFDDSNEGPLSGAGGYVSVLAEGCSVVSKLDRLTYQSMVR